jgi:hypothetical protein
LPQTTDAAPLPTKGRPTMTSQLADTQVRAGMNGVWPVCTILALAFAVACCLLLYVVVKGPQLTAEMEARNAQEIEQENQAFCGKFGMQPGTPAFAGCAAELMKIREQHEVRLTRGLVD